MKQKILLCFLIFSILASYALQAYAHSGRTDSSGGHRDTKNASGLGAYHYHHGYGPHLHPNGVCPYGATAAPPKTSKPESSAQTTSSPSKDPAALSGNAVNQVPQEESQYTVIAEETKVFERANRNSPGLARVEAGYTFTPTGSTEFFWQISFKKKDSDTPYTGYLLKEDCTAANG